MDMQGDLDCEIVGSDWLEIVGSDCEIIAEFYTTVYRYITIYKP